MNQCLWLTTRVHKDPWFTALNPNGKIPTLVDHDNGDFVVNESQGKLITPMALYSNWSFIYRFSAILTYLIRTYDKENKFFFTNPKDISRCEQWLSFHTSEIMPAQINAIRFCRYFPEKGEQHPFAMQMFVGECERLYGVLDTALEGRNYLVGAGKGKYSIADIANWTFVNLSGICKVGMDLDKWPNLNSWYKSIAERPAVKKGVQVPIPLYAGNEHFLKRIAENSEEAEKEAALTAVIKEAQELYGHKCQFP